MNAERMAMARSKVDRALQEAHESAKRHVEIVDQAQRELVRVLSEELS